ncbi:L-lactate dehydrogenase B-A chain [Liparis tanakae]|uniref:L-lactate dehydrogenase B-A chain n=1 Tax=Liparis tanakae TaxID=230148 RepID=A0A4Z2I0T8_9TELE|nr:L-lactate dehydrogenase B-A chain [Liparis tanakae]
MASILQKLITPLFSGPPEPPRNKVTVVGVGQVGMACAISILLREEVYFGWHGLAASGGEVVTWHGVVGHVAAHRLHHVAAAAAAALAELRMGAALHVAPAQRQEGHEARDQLLADDGGAEETA